MFRPDLVKNLLYKMFHESVSYLEIDTEFTKHYIEKLTLTCRDRGKYRWFAETKKEAWQIITENPQAEKCLIDRHDCFPRLYFLEESCIHELLEWLNVRDEPITKIFSPDYSDQII